MHESFGKTLAFDFLIQLFMHTLIIQVDFCLQKKKKNIKPWQIYFHYKRRVCIYTMCILNYWLYHPREKKKWLKKMETYTRPFRRLSVFYLKLHRFLTFAFHLFTILSFFFFWSSKTHKSFFKRSGYFISDPKLSSNLKNISISLQFYFLNTFYIENYLITFFCCCYRNINLRITFMHILCLIWWGKSSMSNGNRKFRIYSISLSFESISFKTQNYIKPLFQIASYLLIAFSDL